MILPNKYVTLTESFVGLSGLILEILMDKKLTVDKLWNKFTKKYIETNMLKTPPTYQKFIYVLEFMYLAKIISYNDKGEILNENFTIKNH